MVVLNFKKKEGIPESEIEAIRETYKRLGSIAKTAAETGYNKNTVNKYVMPISCKKHAGRYSERMVCKIEPETGKIIRKYKNCNTAALITHISAANISHAVNGRTKTAGGYVWRYADQYNAGEFPVENYFTSHVREMDILLGIK